MTDKKELAVTELLKPRYKVIADYPTNKVSIGHIFTAKSESAIEYFEQYPAIFEKLEWWEDRKPEEMPKYLKSVEPPHQFATLDRPYISFFEGGVNGQYIEAPYYEFLPATEAEYLAFINNQTPTK